MKFSTLYDYCCLSKLNISLLSVRCALFHLYKSLESISVLSEEQVLDKLLWFNFLHYVYHENIWLSPFWMTFCKVAPIYWVGDLATLVSKGETWLSDAAKWKIYFKTYLIIWAKLYWVLSTNFQWKIWQARNDYWDLGLFCASVHTVLNKLLILPSLQDILGMLMVRSCISISVVFSHSTHSPCVLVLWYFCPLS